MTRARLKIEIQQAAGDAATPAAAFFERCARRVLADSAGELVIRVVDAAESETLNSRYRGKPAPTNVLAFPAGAVPGLHGAAVPLGDIVICAAIVAREAREQGKSLEAHWAHMIIHGCLHVLGYDHETEAEAAVMEALERRLLSELGFDDPYGSDA